jgi:hypothetical protein
MKCRVKPLVKGIAKIKTGHTRAIDSRILVMPLTEGFTRRKDLPEIQCRNMLYKVTSRFTAKFLAGHYDGKMSSIGTVPSYNCP